MIMIILYLLLSCIVGFLGRNQPLGFVGYTLVSLFLTPLFAFLILLFMTLYTKLAIRGIKKRKEKQEKQEEEAQAAKSPEPEK